MRWKLSLAAPAFLLLVLATDGLAQVPVTVTIPPEPSPVNAVTFPDIPPGTTFQADNTGKRIQHFVGVANASEGRYMIKAVLTVGSSEKDYSFSFAEQDACQNTSQNEGEINRITCSVVEHGVGLVCSAIYSGMDSPPEPTCEGTMACIRCESIKVCGSRPECE